MHSSRVKTSFSGTLRHVFQFNLTFDEAELFFTENNWDEKEGMKYASKLNSYFGTY